MVVEQAVPAGAGDADAGMATATAPETATAIAAPTTANDRAARINSISTLLVH